MGMAPGRGRGQLCWWSLIFKKIISPASEAPGCSDCHGSTARMDLKGELGYQLKGPESQICTQCHGKEESEGFYDLHEEHVEEERYDCSRCHTFSRPERNP